MPDLSSLAWELLASVPYATGRLTSNRPEVAHQRVVGWLSESDANVAMGEAWLTLFRTEHSGDSPQIPTSEHALKEFALRQPIEQAIRGRPDGGGIVGFVHYRRLSVRRWWRSRRRRGHTNSPGPLLGLLPDLTILGDIPAR